VGYNDASECPTGHFSRTALTTVQVVTAKGCKLIWGFIIFTNAATVTFELASGTDHFEPIVGSIGQVLPLQGMNLPGSLSVLATAAVCIQLHYTDFSS
jgi:hypothetical protein